MSEVMEKFLQGTFFLKSIPGTFQGRDLLSPSSTLWFLGPSRYCKLGLQIYTELVYFWLSICLGVYAFGSPYNLLGKEVSLPTVGGR